MLHQNLQNNSGQNILNFKEQIDEKRETFEKLIIYVGSTKKC